MRNHFAKAFIAFGNPCNPPLLFLHGVRLGAEIWNEHAQALADEFYIVAPDLPSHGTLSHLPFEPAFYQSLLAYIADDVLTRPPLIVGYSLGGYVAMRHACELPERTAGLVLTGCTFDVTGARRYPYEAAVALSAQIPPALLQKGLASFLRMALPKDVADTVVPFAFNQRAFEESRTTMCGVRYSRKLRAYDKPVLIVNGQWDLLFRSEEAKFARAANAEVRVMRDVGHAAPLRAPHAFTAIVREFAQRVFAEA